jgi:prevent-host-death family protein
MRTKRMSVKRFCERCLEVFDEVYETGQKYVITRNGKGVIRVVPPDGWELPKRSKSRRKKKR